MLEQMRQHPVPGLWCGNGSEIKFEDLVIYAEALLEDSRNDREVRMSIASRTRSGGIKKRDDTDNKLRDDADNKLLLVYPFDVKEKLLSEAASGLKELGGDLLGLDKAEMTVLAEHDEDNCATQVKKKTRTHYVTIREEDKERLCPGQFLNDTLVDLWMRW
jgi:Ulp1 family protease